jgi:hypothetical protein
MENGRLVRVTKPLGNAGALGYIVSLSDPAHAIALVRAKVADPEDRVEDVCRVSGALLRSLALSAGRFVCASRQCKAAE